MRLSPDAPPRGTIRDWLDSRAKAGGTAIVFPEINTDIDWETLRDAAKGFAHALTARGCAKGESVAVLSPNTCEGVIALYGALYGGFRATMINLAAGRDAIAYALTHSKARFSYVHPDARDLFEQAGVNNITSISLTEGDACDLHQVAESDHALLMYTSGTTGRPKGVVHTHASLLAGGWTTAVAHGLSPSDRGFCVLPIYHINGLCVTVIGSLVSGGSLAMTSRFSARKFWQQAETGQVTWFSVVPTIISHLLHGEAEPSAVLKSKLRFGRSASSALAVETQNGFETRFGVAIIETMGLTETAAQILSNPMPPATRKIGSPGTAYGCEVAIHDTEGNEVPAGQEGEIVVRGPNVMLEYLFNQEATTGTFRGDWLRTGDLARADADGFVFVTGRLKELIIKGGENVAPREVDEALYAHPDVMEAAAFARPCTRYGETIEAAVRLRDGAMIDEQVLLELCIEKLGRFKTPDVVHFMPDLPKGPSGKIQRLKLADLT